MDKHQQLTLSLYCVQNHMMSLNQKVLYLILLITLLYELASANQNITIYVQPNGTDQSECMEGHESIPCHTLSYVLNQINNRNNDIFGRTYISVYVYITYSQDMNDLIMILLLPKLHLIGINNPVLDFGENQKAIFTGIGSFYAENITFLREVYFYATLKTISFNECIFTGWSGVTLSNYFGWQLTIESVSNVIISNCLFHNNELDSDRDLVKIGTAKHVKISGCEFYLNYLATGNLIDISQNLTKFEMDNCSIYDNDASVVLSIWPGTIPKIVIITNCLFSNNTAVANIIYIHVNRLYMSNVILVSNTIKFMGNIVRLHPIGQQFDILNYKPLYMSNVNFINNSGTALMLEDATVHFNNITFYNNTGDYGGGMSLYEARIVLLGPLRFIKNTALLGGAIYITALDYDTHDLLTDFITCNTLEQITFYNNHAVTLAPDIFIEDGFSTDQLACFTFPCSPKTGHDGIKGDHIISGPRNISINTENNSTVTLFPGQKLTYSAHVTDYFGNLTSCFIKIFLQCGNYFCEYVQLTGDAQSLISTSDITTNLYLLSTYEHYHTSMNMNLLFVCEASGSHKYVNVNLTACVLGFVFRTPQKSQSIQGTCECVDIDSDDVQCDFMLGVACIRLGYWFGEINANDELDNTVNDTAPCQYPYCKTDLPPCSIRGLSQTYNQLPVAQDEQCNGLYGGLLCRSCREGAVFSFEVVKCIPSSNCQPWQPYVISVLVVIFQLVLGFGIVIGLKASFKTGIGHLYGPLFFIAVLRLVPFGYYKEYIQLKFIVSIFQSVLLLNLEIFGEIPWCFFSNINPLLNYSLHFIGPFIIAVVLLSTVMLARYYPRQFLSLQSSPVQAICLLILLSFWSVSDTCIQLLKPTTTLSGVKGWRVALQPNIQYLKDPYHIVTWIISIVLLVFLLVPFILLLFLSPLLRRKFNLTRIQPLLDAFQSCYDDRFRWYSGVYILSWIILNINMPYYVMEIILVAVGTLHFMIHPYKYRWLNIVDTLLLVDLIMLAFLTSVDSPNNIQETVPISYILVVLPLTYITIGGVWIISVIIMKWCKRKVCTGKNTNAEEMVNLLDEEEEEVVDSGDIDIHIGVNSTVLEHPVCRRESLIFDDN